MHAYIYIYMLDPGPRKLNFLLLIKFVNLGYVFVFFLQFFTWCIFIFLSLAKVLLQQRNVVPCPVGLSIVCSTYCAKVSPVRTGALGFTLARLRVIRCWWPAAGAAQFILPTLSWATVGASFNAVLVAIIGGPGLLTQAALHGLSHLQASLRFVTHLF